LAQKASSIDRQIAFSKQHVVVPLAIIVDA
jgi:hypothetical protein